MVVRSKSGRLIVNVPVAAREAHDLVLMAEITGIHGYTISSDSRDMLPSFYQLIKLLRFMGLCHGVLCLCCIYI